MRVLITGFTGFVGSYMAELALSKPGAEVYGTYRSRSRLDNISHIADKVKMVECDMRDSFAVESVVRQVRPDYVFHLAAQSYVPTSWVAPGETLTTNILGELNLLEAIRRFKNDARVQIACSSEEYGLVHPDELPINEDNPLRPLSPYGVSKVAQDLLAYQYHASYGLHVVRTRAFNHTGPRRGEVFVTSNFCRQVAAIEKGDSPPVLMCGSLEAVRDFTDVRDMVRGYWSAVELGEPGEVYVLASGRGWSIRQLLDMVLSLSTRSIEVRQDPDRMRPSDVPILIGDPAKIRRRTGWVAEIPFEKTLTDLLDSWRSRA